MVRFIRARPLKTELWIIVRHSHNQNRTEAHLPRFFHAVPHQSRADALPVKLWQNGKRPKSNSVGFRTVRALKFASGVQDMPDNFTVQLRDKAKLLDKVG